MREAVLIQGEVRAYQAPAPLAVTQLALTDFRCYASLRLSAACGPVVLYGPNGAGKTNLLEALSLLVPGRGLRRARQADVLREDAGTEACWAVAASVATQEGEVRIGTGRDPRAAARDEEDVNGDDETSAPERRLVRIDGEPRGPAALGEVMRAVWLTPEMDRLFIDGASARRRFLDRAIQGLDRGHAARLNAYQRTLRERSKLLRGMRADPLWLDVLEDRMACDGVAIAAARIHAAERISAVASEGFGPFPGAMMKMEGAVEDSLAEVPALEAETRLHDALTRSRAEDAMTGGAAVGPHRSDLRVRHRATNRPAERCSTGEQKALMIAMVLAIAVLQAREQGAAPILLLDEVAAHLDSARRGALFERILDLGAQTWMTGTGPAAFAGLEGRAQAFRVGDGCAIAA
ncbi:MAG TPA: DNA replication/repair protein RecF [Alphaproteobacteria bacterium]|nr:DNA replication/repair protein RecF [Alphaproteobacteria bacterium]